MMKSTKAISKQLNKLFKLSQPIKHKEGICLCHERPEQTINEAYHSLASYFKFKKGKEYISIIA